MPSSNPFVPSPATPQTSAPSITLSSPPPQHVFDSSDLEEPPPYTPNASVTSGETTVEVGPSRPFQTTQPSPNRPRNGASQVSHGRTVPSPSFPSTSSSSLPLQQRSTSAVQQLSNSFNEIVNHLSSLAVSSSNNLNRAPSTGPSNNWTSYPGQNPRPPPPPSNPTSRSANNFVPPPQHPQSSLHPPLSASSTRSLPSMTSHSDFARDFYAAGSGGGENLVATQSVPNDGRPTSQPHPGHPLLKDGNLLVYPKGFECKKCHNMGYIGGIPQKPCNQCWKKYAKPFSGPLVYSFPANSPSSSLASNLQKPLPHNLPSSAPPVASSSASQPARNNPGRQPSSSSQGGFRNPPPTAPMRPMPPVSPLVAPRPATGSGVTYFAGDPRIGGTLCWKCGGKGSFEMFLFRDTCPICSGVGRIFN